jgi:geranylgeranyl diphosphate synthase type I
VTEPPPPDLEARATRYRDLVTAEMRAVVGDRPEGLYAWMRYHLGWEDPEGNPVSASPGKMMRPVGLLLATELAGGDPQQAVPAAAALELVHNFSLLHDDIEDRSDRRRDRPTLWTFAGEAQALNTGDGMYTVAHLAMYNLLDRGVPPDVAVRAMRELDQTCIRLVHGQYLDISFEERSDVTLDEYIEMAAGKTAAMFAAPLAIGATIAGADEPVVAAFRAAGRHIGLGFQMIDDVLGIWGNPAVTGKPVGDDLRSRKMTYPVITALSGPTDLSGRLSALYGKAFAAEEEIGEIASLIEAAGGRTATEARANDERDRAVAALEDAGVASEALEQLTAFAAQAVWRVS